MRSRMCSRQIKPSLEKGTPVHWCPQLPVHGSLGTHTMPICASSLFWGEWVPSRSSVEQQIALRVTVLERVREGWIGMPNDLDLAVRVLPQGDVHNKARVHVRHQRSEVINAERVFVHAGTRMRKRSRCKTASSHRLNLFACCVNFRHAVASICGGR
jgi:hypothetical protein